MCWYCTYGLPQPVAEVYKKYEALIGERDLDSGPAHVVWGDFNLGTHSINYCIQACDERGIIDAEDYSLVKASLVELLAIPEIVRCPVECDTDEPPPPGMVMVHV